MSKLSFSSDELADELQRIKYRRRFWIALRNTLYVLFAVAGLAILIAVIWLPVLRIYGSSMNKTLTEDDIVLTQKGASVKKGDILAFYYNNKVLVKRVIAKSGDWVTVDSQGDVYVNQKKLKEPYLQHKALGESNIKYPYQVPDQQIFVMGDNRKTSIDSRNTAVGTVSQEQIIGRIFFKVWPLQKLGPISQ
ncbi:signal peptidase I [Streptococcus didelphis]|uniref:Signal peptidase I n=1 Tax=Streptococcus didelphis TaxID=102886 RepID=A0ABY9LGM6_9STRE|nr:signal peptidase I [Streptococcus didelphis]WMB28013.1 signal peptidase I [Streptococcus didelphis]WMB29916.1 signal peptidase I [Streptococcus didelphis]